jgi:hypothetical protein
MAPHSSSLTIWLVVLTILCFALIWDNRTQRKARTVAEQPLASLQAQVAGQGTRIETTFTQSTSALSAARAAELAVLNHRRQLDARLDQHDQANRVVTSVLDAHDLRIESLGIAYAQGKTAPPWALILAYPPVDVKDDRECKAPPPPPPRKSAQIERSLVGLDEMLATRPDDVELAKLRDDLAQQALRARAEEGAAARSLARVELAKAEAENAALPSTKNDPPEPPKPAIEPLKLPTLRPMGAEQPNAPEPATSTRPTQADLPPKPTAVAAPTRKPTLLGGFLPASAAPVEAPAAVRPPGPAVATILPPPPGEAQDVGLRAAPAVHPAFAEDGEDDDKTNILDKKGRRIVTDGNGKLRAPRVTDRPVARPDLFQTLAAIAPPKASPMASPPSPPKDSPTIVERSQDERIALARERGIVIDRALDERIVLLARERGIPYEEVMAQVLAAGGFEPEPVASGPAETPSPMRAPPLTAEKLDPRVQRLWVQTIAAAAERGVVVDDALRQKLLHEAVRVIRRQDQKNSHR